MFDALNLSTVIITCNPRSGKGRVLHCSVMLSVSLATYLSLGEAEETFSRRSALAIYHRAGSRSRRAAALRRIRGLGPRIITLHGNAVTACIT